MQRSALCRSRRELSNEYLLDEIGVDTAENEPLEVWGKIQFIIHSPPWLQGHLACRLVDSRGTFSFTVGLNEKAGSASCGRGEQITNLVWLLIFRQWEEQDKVRPTHARGRASGKSGSIQINIFLVRAIQQTSLNSSYDAR